MTLEPTVDSLFDLRGKVALITGGTGYLGSAMSRALAEIGAQVVVTSRELVRAEQAAVDLPGEQQHFGVELDHKSEESIATGFARAVQLAGKVDILVNNGQGGNAKDLTTTDQQHFDEHLANATGYFLLARECRNHVVARGVDGSIVNIGSMYGVVGSYPEVYQDVSGASPVAYHALKGGVVHMTRHLAVYWAADNVRVNCLSPGPFPSEKAPAALVDRLIEKSPMKRMGIPSELKGAIVFLCSNASSYVTGQNLLVDGGWTAW